MKLIILRGKTGSGKSTLQDLIVSTFQYKKVVIDDIKMKKYGTTAQCKPEIDFKEAGSIARELLLNGHNVIVEEAFLEQTHLSYFLQGLENETPSIIYIRLECSESTAMTRKLGILNTQTINFQHSRPVDNIDGELIFNTDTLTSGNILDAIRDKII